MLHVKKNASAFTLIELLVVVIIVAVLASVGIPLLSASIDRAKTSEAEAGLGTVRTGLRAYFAEHGNYPTASSGDQPTSAALSPFTGVKSGDLTGRFFEDDDYTYTSAAGATYCIKVVGDATGAAQRSGAGLQRSMSELGNLYSGTDCSTGLLN